MPLTSTQRALLTRPGTVLTVVRDAHGAARLMLVRRKSRRPVREIQDLLNDLQQTHGLLDAVEWLRQACRPEVLRSGRQRGLTLDPVIDSRVNSRANTTVRVSVSLPSAPREASCTS